MRSFHTRSAILACFPKVIQGLGHDPFRLLKHSGIAPEQLHDTNATISHASFVSLLKNASQVTGCNHLGLLLGEGASLQNIGLLGLLARSSSTLGEALEGVIKHLKIHSTGLSRELHSDGGISYVACILESPEMAKSIQAIQMSVALTWKLSQLLSPKKGLITAIYFTFSEPANKIFYRQFFNTKVLFNMEFNGLVFHSADLSLPMTEQDSFLHTEILKQVTRIESEFTEDLLTDVKRYIQKNLDVGVCSVDAVVQFFPFEKRAFQQKLKKIGTSYQELLDEIRFQKAEFHLASTNIAVSQLASLLCFKSTSVFSTAFKKRYGKSPSAWRAEQI